MTPELWLQLAGIAFSAGGFTHFTLDAIRTLEKRLGAIDGRLGTLHAKVDSLPCPCTTRRPDDLDQRDRLRLPRHYPA